MDNHIVNVQLKNMNASKQQNCLKSFLHSISPQDLFVLLDLIGGPNPRFGNQFSSTTRWLSRLQNIG